MPATPQHASHQPQPTAGVQPTGRRRGRSGQPSLRPASVEDAITDDVVTAERDTPVRTLVAQMDENDVGAVVVVDDDEPVDVITDRTVALAMEETPDIAQRNAEDLIEGDVVVADPSMSVFDALQLMSHEDVRRLPVVDEDGTLQGILTLDDALVLLGSGLGDAAETIQSQSTRL